jgi:plasmid maintenance system antidote protein VapI
MDADLQALMLNEIREILETQFAGVQSDMARATGISLPRINGLIRGKILITNKTLSKIKGSIETSTASHDISPVKNTSRQAIYIQRRTRLNEIIYMQFGGVIKKFAEAVELAQSTAWQIANGKQNIGEKLARRIEKALLLLPGDLDAIRAIADLNQSSRTALRRERLISVIDQVFGGDLAACARHLNLAETYLHSLQTGSRAIGDSTARLIEKRVLLEAGAFDRLEEIAFPVRSVTPHGEGVEIKLALLQSYLQENVADSKTCALLHSVIDIATERFIIISRQQA